jgi:Nucleotidyl transferase AbiEii toxin, Type IV TA system
VSSFPETKTPFSVKVLEAWILQRAGGNDEQKNRLRRGISYMVVSAVLGELRETDGTPLFILKGGVAMQLRFGIRARLSQDYDAAFRREIKHLEDVLADAPNHPVGGFMVRAVGKPEALGPTGAFRQTLKLTYQGRGWGEVRLEVSPPEGRSVDLDQLDHIEPDPDPSVFGLEKPEPIPCMPVRYQIAQKLHACTEVKDVEEGKEPNERFHDLLDLQLLEELVADDGWMGVRDACVETFEIREKQPWPPRVTIYGSWPASYARVAIENSFPVTDVSEAASRVQTMIDRIDEARRDPSAGSAPQDDPERRIERP